LLSNNLFPSKYFRIAVGWGFVPDPTGEVYSRPLAGFKGPLSGIGKYKKDGEGIGERTEGKW